MGMMLPLETSTYIILMLLQVAFFLYFAVLLLYIFVFGLCYYRIQAKWGMHPQVFTLLLPFILNFFAAKFLFVRVNSFITTLVPCLLIYFVGKQIQKVRIFGLTGGIASGKSTLVNMMADSLHDQLHVIDCDKINRELSQKGNAGYNLILSLLGDKKEEYLMPSSREINRQKFSDFVFRNPDFRKVLTAKMGRKIMWTIFKQIYSCIWSKKKLVMIDAPILFETKVLEYICYPIIVIGCPPETQIKRMVQKRGMTEEQAKNRINSQMPLSLKKQKADIYTQNNTTPEDMFTNTLVKLNKILAIKRR